MLPCREKASFQNSSLILVELSCAFEQGWAIVGYLGSSWANLDQSGPACATFKQFRDIVSPSGPSSDILNHSGPFCNTLGHSRRQSPAHICGYRLLVKNTFHADRFFVGHRAKENEHQLVGVAKRCPPPQRARRAPWAPHGALGAGWGILSCKSQQKHEQSETCTCSAREKFN